MNTFFGGQGQGFGFGDCDFFFFKFRQECYILLIPWNNAFLEQRHFNISFRNSRWKTNSDSACRPINITLKIHLLSILCRKTSYHFKIMEHTYKKVRLKGKKMENKWEISFIISQGPNHNDNTIFLFHPQFFYFIDVSLLTYLLYLINLIYNIYKLVI